jgi:hypothetical protein
LKRGAAAAARFFAGSAVHRTGNAPYPRISERLSLSRDRAAVVAIQTDPHFLDCFAPSGARDGGHPLLMSPCWTIQAASAGFTRRAISSPRSPSTTAISYWLCNSSQNCGLLPK